MLSIVEIRKNPEEFTKALNRRKPGMGDEVIPILLQNDKKLRELTTLIQNEEGTRNTLSKKIGIAMGNKDEAEVASLMELVKDTDTTMNEAKKQEQFIREQLKGLLLCVPNIPMNDVPDGKDEHNNIEQYRKGVIKNINEPQDHTVLGEALTIQGFPQMDFEAAARMSGARFVVLRGQLARLERALANLMLDIHTEKFGYVEASVPLLVKPDTMVGTGQLPKFGSDSFETGSGHWLIATSEIPLTNLVRDQILDGRELPLRYTAHTPCFRSEAGSAGRDTKGMIRQHQFYKVELVSIVKDEESGLAELERITVCAETILDHLKLPYRRVLLCAGDIGDAARKTYDLEVWLPSQGVYREISSCSYCGTFQALRMNARHRPEPGSKPEYVHTLNGSGLAIGRTLVAILENYQNEDGSITVPDVLIPYMGGLEIIGVP